MKLYELKTTPSDFEKVKLNSSESASNYIRKFYSDDIEIYESCFILLLNRANETIGYAKISQGGITGTVVDVKIVCKYVVDSFASGIILAHNHPSGNTQPSEGDKDVTKKIKEALKMFDTTLYDHIILTPKSYFSFIDNDML